MVLLRITFPASRRSIVIIEFMSRFQWRGRAVSQAVYQQEKGSAVAQPAE